MQTFHFIQVFRSSSTSPGEGATSSAMTTGTSDSTGEDLVVTQLMDVLTEFGLNEGSDYTREELEEPLSLSEAYPEYTSTTSNKMDEEASTTASAEDIGEDCDLTSEVYWYHPNYLGNVDLVTDIDGKVHQFFLYTAWGEELNSYTGTSSEFDSPYRFNGKELDEETGLAYYGARYYDNQLSMWLSVDPLAMKDDNMTMSPYNFTDNNPVMLVDPDGMNATDPERRKAISYARKYVSMNPKQDGSLYVLGHKNGPGETVDCSGLVNNSIIQAGVADMNSRDGAFGRGVQMIMQGSRKVSLDGVVAGNAVVIDWDKKGGSPHVGIITEVTRNANSEVTGFKFIHSSRSKGPTESTYNRGGSRYYDDIDLYSGFYAWDTESWSPSTDPEDYGLSMKLWEWDSQTLFTSVNPNDRWGNPYPVSELPVRPVEEVLILSYKPMGDMTPSFE